MLLAKERTHSASEHQASAARTTQTGREKVAMRTPPESLSIRRRKFRLLYPAAFNGERQGFV
jgi:hypothetical protein